jgi:tryptophan synthase alpha subunit
VQAALAMGAAGAISGSAIVKKLVGGEDVAEFVREMKGATKGSS